MLGNLQVVPAGLLYRRIGDNEGVRSLDTARDPEQDVNEDLGDV